MSEHTKGPWVVTPAEQDSESNIMYGEWYVATTWDHANSVDAETNATRIVTCVNALDGLTNEQVGKLGALFEAIRSTSADPYAPTVYGDIIPAARAAGIIKE